MSKSTKPTLFSDQPVKSVPMLSAIKSTKTKPKASKFWNILAMISCVFALVLTVYNFLN
ncbi:hypothetical protein HYG89_05090 [Acinetobacter sp. SwsAc5]|uniref:hypothetical protein n=1 Tax=Acinetobacter sp. SwsAc5 TaxID=2749438 RepID=UPI0015B947B8|nr:hypothetical protein [Acinetobacter sp. SwsAc5]NWK51942.1 hypothetical protein [Acinetobacter sp. SwsAc5]